MEMNTLVRGSSHESEEAKDFLIAANIQFREVFSSSSYHSPVLITGSSAFAYKGVASIREYCDYKKTQGMVAVQGEPIHLP